MIPFFIRLPSVPYLGFDRPEAAGLTLTLGGCCTRGQYGNATKRRFLFGGQ
jgi:hypothetical protein